MGDLSNGALEPVRGMGAAGDVRGSQLSSKALAASGRAAWGPPASCRDWVSSAEGVSIGMQGRGERGHHVMLHLRFLSPLHLDSPWRLCLGCWFSLKALIVLLAGAAGDTAPSLPLQPWELLPNSPWPDLDERPDGSHSAPGHPHGHLALPGTRWSLPFPIHIPSTKPGLSDW